MRLRLFVQIVSIEARKAMSYRADFWVSAIGGVLANFGLAWFLWRAMFAAADGDRIGEFTFDSMLLYYVVVILIGRFVRGATLDMNVSVDIYEGGLTRYLVFPARYFPFKYAQHLGALAPAVLQIVVMGALFAVFIGIPDDVQLTLPRILAALFTVLAANLLYFQFNLPLQSVSFWADNVWSLAVALRMLTSLLGGLLLPLSMFPEWAQSALAWTPFPLLFDTPARVLLGKLTFGDWIHQLAVSAVWMIALAFLARWVWARGRLQYSGVGI